MFKLYINKLMFYFLSLGIASGIPFFLVLSSLSFWLSESGISPAIIGLFIWCTIPYSLKFLWSPLIDQTAHFFKDSPLLRYKIWGIGSQAGLIICTILLSFLTPKDNLWLMAFTAFLLSFFAATLDIVIDTIRIEVCQKQINGVVAAVESIGFRLGMLIGGAGALYLASLYDWKTAYTLLGIAQIFIVPILWKIPDCCIINTCSPILTPNTIFMENPVCEDKGEVNQFGTPSYNIKTHENSFSSISLSAASSQSLSFWTPPLKIKTYYKESLDALKQKTPFCYLLALIFIFKLPDTVLNAMSAPFLYSIGFDKLEYANVTKTFGIPLMILGSMVAGHLIHQLGERSVAAIVIFMQAISCLLFVLQYHVGHDIQTLFITIGIESFTSGMATTIFIAIISSYCKMPFAAGHFTFFNAIGSLSRVIFSALGGGIGSLFGWGTLFTIAALTTIPAFSFLIKIRQYEKEKKEKEKASILLESPPSPYPAPY